MQLKLAPKRSARYCAASASSSGPMSFDGVLMRSRANVAASVMRVMAAISTPSGGISLTSDASALR